MSQGPEVPNEGDLPSVDREMTRPERERAERLSNRGWAQVIELLTQRSKTSYSVAKSQTFTRCVQQHLNEADRDELIAAEVFHCPQCGTLLKDRQGPVASSILLERQRIARLWVDVEQAKSEEFDEKLNRFRRALGLPQ